jgi:hypothetical protein
MICVKLRSVNLTEHIPLCYGSIEKNNIYIFFEYRVLIRLLQWPTKQVTLLRDLLKNMKEAKFLV